MKKKVIKKVKAVKIETAKQMFAALREFFESEEVSSSDRSDVWSVLTGLRGPDEKGSEVKAATTAIIRAKLFGKDAIIPATLDIDSDEAVEVRSKLFGGVTDHFEHHARQAFDALGLEWHSFNDPNEWR